MITKLCNRLLRRLRRDVWRITSATVLAALTATSLGIAVPKIVQRVSDELYPCMNCSCSCPSAEVCWKDCCCFTQQQKLDWAERNGVQPPEFVVVAAQQEKEIAKLPSCCQKRLAKASCCSKKAGCCSQKSTCEKAAEEATTSRTVLLLDVLRCRGLSSHWTLLPPCIVPPLTEADDTLDPLSERSAVSDSLYASISCSPESPPPQRDV